MLKMLWIALAMLFFATCQARAADFTLLDAVTTNQSSVPLRLDQPRAIKTYWVTISGTATVQLEHNPFTSGGTFYPLVTNGLTSTSFVDTTAPASQVRVTVSGCSGCTVTVLLQVN